MNKQINTTTDERALVGQLIANYEQARKEVGVLKKERFKNPHCKQAVEAILKLEAKGVPVDAVTVMDESKIPASILQEIIDSACIVGHCAYHAQQIEGAYFQRKAGEIIQQSGGGVEGIRQAVQQIEEILPEQATATTAQSLAELPSPMDEATNPSALFQNGYLRKGGGMFLVSTSGTGKSVISIQAAICWTAGKPAFGMRPPRPLKIAIIQAEDDAEELAHFRDEITQGLIESKTLTPEEVKRSCSNIILPSFIGKVGEDFLTALREWSISNNDIDLIILNPLQSYFGGDLAKNSDISKFLRGGMDPIIKPSKFGILIVHHTNKPPNKRDRDGWGTDQFSAYLGAGGAELVNWARAVMLLMPTEKMGLYCLTAAKRGKRLDWTDAEGNPTNRLCIAHSDGLIFWRDATPEEAASVSTGNGKGATDREAQAETDADALATIARKKTLKLGDLREAARAKFSRNRGDRAFQYLTRHLREFSLHEAQATYKGASFIGTTADTEAAARKWDATNGGEY